MNFLSSLGRLSISEKWYHCSMFSSFVYDDSHWVFMEPLKLWKWLCNPFQIKDLLAYLILPDRHYLSNAMKQFSVTKRGEICTTCFHSIVEQRTATHHRVCCKVRHATRTYACKNDRRGCFALQNNDSQICSHNNLFCGKPTPLLQNTQLWTQMDSG